MIAAAATSTMLAGSLAIAVNTAILGGGDDGVGDFAFEPAAAEEVTVPATVAPTAPPTAAAPPQVVTVYEDVYETVGGGAGGAAAPAAPATAPPAEDAAPADGAPPPTAAPRRAPAPTPAPTTAPPTTPPTTVTAPPTTSAPVRIATYQADGAGSVTVDTSTGRIVIAAVDAASGWTGTVARNDGKEATVVFRSGGESVLWKGHYENGRMEVETGD